MVGRENELAQLHAALERAVADRTCGLFTVVGEAGVGKSRLVREFLAGVEAPVVGGRCLPYGKGITYWPVVEIVKHLDVRPSDEAAAAAIGSLLGENEAGASAEEIAWGFRKLLEEAAAEAARRGLRRHPVGRADLPGPGRARRAAVPGAPILLLCMARPELAERRAGLAVGAFARAAAAKEVAS